ncbi:hypothetical protein BOTU111921_01435 [Bordetella tumbae]|uniref:hypothetical protein n=1 Tax=Bordetella tumbae TaxID=1649139 RepID=UPI0039EFC862
MSISVKTALSYWFPVHTAVGRAIGNLISPQKDSFKQASDLIKEHNPAEFNKFITDEKFDVMATDKNGQTLLHVAAASGNQEEVDMLIGVANKSGQRLDLVNAKDHTGKSALDIVKESPAGPSRDYLKDTISYAQLSDAERTEKMQDQQANTVSPTPGEVKAKRIDKFA